MDMEIKEMFNAVLNQLDRMEGRLKKQMNAMEDRFDDRFEQVGSRLDGMRHEINACRPERDSVSLLIKKVDELEQRVAG